jgi:hypothetical protein
VLWGTLAAISAWLVGKSGPAERISWSWRRAARRAGRSAGLALVIGIVVLGGYGVAAGPRDGFQAGAVFAAGSGAIALLVSGFTRADIPVHVTPNEATRRSFWSGLMSGTVALALLGVVFASLRVLLAPGPLPPLSMVVRFAVLLGLPVATIVAVPYGLGAALQHWLIRLLLWANRAAPLRYSRWLDYAVALKLLYRNGAGGYVFIHGLMRQYFITSAIDPSRRPDP